MTNDLSALFAAAHRIARKLGHPRPLPVHLLAGALAVDTPASRILAGFGLTPGKVGARLKALRADPGGQAPDPGALTRALDVVTHEARAGHPDPILVLVRHLLTSGDPLIEDLVTSAHAQTQEILAALDAVGEPARASQGSPTRVPAGALAKYGTDLTALAQAGALAPMIGRARELNRVVTVLARRTKNSPVLIGEAGVGKTAIVEGLAAHLNTLVDGPLARRRLISLDVAGMLAGASARGDFEQRIKAVIAEAIATSAVVFIDEIHQIVGAGGTRGGLDVANLLKEPMARGALTVIGATTLEEYRKFIEADPALERRLEPVRVEAMSVADTIALLSGVSGQFAAHHKVTYTKAAVRAAAVLTDRHVPDRNLPDKAIDALDEAGAAAAIAISRAPGQVADLYAARAQVRRELAAAVAEERYEDAGALVAKDKALTGQLGVDLGVVDVAQIAQVVAATARVPVTAVTEAMDRSRLAALPQRLRARVVGQDEAVDEVAAAVRRRLVLGAERPAALMFAGPTGVGKTELAKALAAELFADAPGSFIRFDMSEFAEKHSVSRLIGAPPGFVGYGQAGELTEAVRRNPFCVVLLDEVEKADPGVFDLLLQVLEDGHLTDAGGRRVSFRDVIVLMTTNLGSAQAARTATGFSSATFEHTRERSGQVTVDAVRAHFRPEFLNRLDKVIAFSSLTRADLTGIVANLLTRPFEQLAAKGVTVRLSDEAIEVLLAAGLDPAMGARPLRRAITRLLENPLSDALLAGQLPPGSTAFVDASGGQLVVLADAPAPAPVVVNP